MKFYKLPIIVILIGIGFVITFGILNLYYSGIIQFGNFLIGSMTILTAYIILYIQISREKDKERKKYEMVFTQLKDLLYFLHENREQLINKQEETKNRISFLITHYKEILIELHINPEPSYQSLILHTSRHTYYINPVAIKKREDSQTVDITDNKVEIELLIKEIESYY